MPESKTEEISDIVHDVAKMRADVQTLSLKLAQLGEIRTELSKIKRQLRLLSNAKRLHQKNEGDVGQERSTLNTEGIVESEAVAPLPGSEVSTEEKDKPLVRPFRLRGANKVTTDWADAELYYQNLGRWKGVGSDQAAQASTKNYWLTPGTNRAGYLVQRIRSEFLVEPLHAVASILADIGRVSISSILAELDHAPHLDQEITLLKALSWMGDRERGIQIQSDKAERILGCCLQSPDPDVREAAVGAIMLLPQHHALVWLKSRLDVESNEDVILRIQDALGSLGMTSER